MIVGFIGDIGGGKTASMVNYAYFKHKMEGKHIMANFHLNEEYFDYTYLTLDDFLTMVENNEGLNDVILLIDELHIWMDSRTSMSKRNRAVSYFALQTRKMDVDLFYTTQYLVQVDLRIRNLSSAIVECYTDTDPIGDKYTLNVINRRHVNKVTTKKYIFPTSKVYNFYDTREIISV